jgi:hypothetical protein
MGESFKYDARKFRLTSFGSGRVPKNYSGFAVHPSLWQILLLSATIGKPAVVNGPLAHFEVMTGWVQLT